MITNKQIQKIKTLQRICGLDDDTYGDILRNKAGVNSCKNLRSKRQISAVMEHLTRLAEKVDKKVKKKTEHWKWENSNEGKQLLEKAKKIAARYNRPSYGQLNYIFGLWWSLRHEWKNDNEQRMESSINHFLENGRGGIKLKVASWQWMTSDMAQHLIDILKRRVAQNKKSKKRISKKKAV